MPRRSDELAQRFHVDAAGPVAAAIVTDWTRAWGLDPIMVPGIANDVRGPVIAEALERLRALHRSGAPGPGLVETLVRDDDFEIRRLLGDLGFEPTDERGGIAWMGADGRPRVSAPPAGFVVEDRSEPDGRPHPMIRRSGPEVESRLRQTSLYDPWLDLSVRTTGGEVAGYALFWFDPVTRVGMVEPMRVEEAWQRRGLGRVLLSTGIDRLADRGATRTKVGWGSPPGRSLYLGAGFVETVAVTTWARPLD